MKLARRFFDESADAGISSDTSPPADTTSADIPSSGSAESSHTDSQPDLPAGVDSQAASAGTAPASSPPSISSLIREKFGVDYSSKYQTDDELLKGLVEASRLVGRRDEYSELGRLYAQEAEGFKQYLNSRRTGQQQPQAASTPEQDQAQGWWNPPEWNEAWNKYLDPETGAPRDDAPLEIRRAAEQRQDYISRWQHQIVFNPEKAFEPLLKQHEERLLKRWNEQQQQLSRQHAIKSQADQIVQQNSQWMFQMSDSGQVLTDDRGMRMFTPAGLMYVDELTKLSQRTDDQELANELAIRRVQERLGAASPAPANVPSAAQRQPNNNGGKVPGKPRVQSDKGLSLRERLLLETADMADKEFVF